LNPDVEIPRKYKLREQYLRDFLKEEFKDTEMVFDKPSGDSKRRPDILINCETHYVIVECDENQHRGYICENRRLMEIFQDLGAKPMVVIRFNPDSYIEKSGEKIPSCFRMTKTVGFKPEKREWERRVKEIVEKLRIYTEKIPEKELTLEYLFYDK
jgi:hypothetical protein